MSRLAARAELTKLRELLGLPPDALGSLEPLPEAQLRRLRDAIGEHLFRQDQRLFQRLAAIAAGLPAWSGALLARALGPMLTARIVGEMSAQRALVTALRLPAAFLAQVCRHVDPRRARELIHRMPSAQVVAVALELVHARDYPTMGRFVAFVDDASIKAVLDALPNESELLRIAFYLDSRNRLDHVVRLLPAERRRRALLLALDTEQDLLDEILALVSGVDFALRRELGDLAASQDEAVLARIVNRVHERGLWGDLLPVVTSLPAESQRRVVNLPQLRDEPSVTAAIVAAADAHKLWRIILGLLPLLDEPQREAFAAAGAELPRAAMARAAQATLVGELWLPTMDLVRRMPFAKQCEFAQVLQGLAGVDPELDQRVIAMAIRAGLGPALTQAGFNAS